MAIVATSYLTDLPHKRSLLWWQKAGLSYTGSGYGRKIPTEHMVKLPGSDRWRRVYVAIFSNAGTAYVEVPGGWHVIEG
jgi:hypothetical protein